MRTVVGIRDKRPGLCFMKENIMCRAVNCRSCGKSTWAGCGNHVQEVMRHIPKAERCTCDPNAPKQKDAGSGWLAKLFGR